MDQRESWDAYFLRMAREVATRATCDRRHVGAVLVIDKMVVSTGYNGSLRGTDHCDQAGHMMVEGHCVRTVHAEANALYQAARRGVRTDGATAYVTDFPCWDCFQALVSAGVVRIVYDRAYRPSELVITTAAKVNVELAPFELAAPEGAQEAVG